MGTALIIGATGGIGQWIAKALRDQGWHVRGLARDPASARKRASWIGEIEWVRGDALAEADVVSAARGADIIVHAANPPGYVRWRELALPMLANSIAAAKASGARILLPGNIYNFGTDAFPLVSEQSPQHPATEKGAIRVEMETMLRESGVRVLILRAGDFLGPHQPASWLKDAMVKPGKPVKAITYPGPLDVRHSWAFLPDLAAAFAALAAREKELPDFDVFHFAGFHLTGAEFCTALARAGGFPDARVRRLPWGLLQFVTPFSQLLRELWKMRYLWRVEIALDNRKLVATLGREPHTPLGEALRTTLDDLGCLPAQATIGAVVTAPEVR